MRAHKNNTRAFKAQRLRVLQRDAWVCAYCGIEGAGTVDHIIPASKGGGDEMENLVACCAPCNGSKGSRSVFSVKPTAPLVFSTSLSLGTTSTVPNGPFTGQNKDRRIS